VLHSMTTPLALQSVIYSFLLPLIWERQRGITTFSASQLRLSTRKRDSWIRLGVVLPNFKEFLASPTQNRFQVLRSFLLPPNDVFRVVVN
jgi:hypothetical protein